MKHLILTAFVSLFIFTSVEAQYRKMELYELSCAADLVLRGKITDQDPLRFTLEVGEVLVGSYTEATILVPRFINTKVAKRWGKYVIGEELLLFLKQDGDHFKILGEGGEGEKLILAEEVCLDSRGAGLKNRFGYHATPTGANIYAEKVPAKEVYDIVKQVRGCYELSYAEKENPEGKKELFPVVKVTCEDVKKDELRSTSWVHDEVIEQAEKAIRGSN